ncbi:MULTISPECIES: hypothetical protein [unclassified Sinorhizobium]|uniref:hypothetical protein n=1 Tax=unclassified Sinorhizobium TaxID=2613772 RepID=UPI0035263AFD
MASRSLPESFFSTDSASGLKSNNQKLGMDDRRLQEAGVRRQKKAGAADCRGNRKPARDGAVSRSGLKKKGRYASVIGDFSSDS